MSATSKVLCRLFGHRYEPTHMYEIVNGIQVCERCGHRRKE